MNLRRIFLYAVLGSLALSAAVGVAALLFGTSRNDRWILSMLSIALFSLLSLGAANAIEHRTWIRAMHGTIALCIVGVCLFLVAIWLPDLPFVNEDFFGKLNGLIATWTIGLTVAGMLAITRFRPPLSLVRIFSIGAIFLLAVVVTLDIFIEPDGDLWLRITGSTAIITALGAIGTPILYKVKGIKEPVETTPLELSIVCPRCLLAQSIASGDSRCAGCRLKFHLEIEEPRCPECNYLLYRLTTPRCPECGHALAAADVQAV
ncbi:MAG TPA: hypothetical protein VFE58_17395 [Tepidisphaeraceae bacterium]|nr:hypothetical protein [Tepidisphaeraceae bacterium]